MEAHIKGHANELPDDDGADSNVSSFESDQYSIKMEKPLDIDSDVGVAAAGEMQHKGKVLTVLPETPRESSSEANSDGDELAYYNGMYQRYDRSAATSSVNSAYATTGDSSGGVNPALLAAVSMASSNLALREEELEALHRRSRSPMEMETEPATPMVAIDMHVANVKQERVMMQQHQHQPRTAIESHHNQHHHQHHHNDHHEMQNTFAYEPLAVMRQQGYFAPVPKVEEYK